MAAENVDETITDELIDGLTMPKALKLCKSHNVDLTSEKVLYRIKYLLKYELLCKNNTRREVRFVGFFLTFYHRSHVNVNVLSNINCNTNVGLKEQDIT